MVADATAILVIGTNENKAIEKLQQDSYEFGTSTKQLKIKLNERIFFNKNFTNKNTTKYLGINLNAKFRWKEHKFRWKEHITKNRKVRCEI